MKFREVVRLPEFEREFKRLLMKHNTLEEDLAKFIDRQLFIYHKLGLDNRGVFPIDDLGSTTAPVFKAKKFACRSLKGRGVKSGIRVIYAYHKGCDRVELSRSTSSRTRRSRIGRGSNGITAKSDKVDSRGRLVQQAFLTCGGLNARVSCGVEETSWGAVKEMFESE